MRGLFESKCPECGNVDNLTERETKKIVHCQRCYFHYEYMEDGKMNGYKIMADNGRQRLYKLDKYIEKGSDGNVIKFGERGKFIPDKLEDTPVNIIVISDALTHLERLAFPVKFVNCEDDKEGITSFIDFGLVPTSRTFKDESNYDKPFVEVEFSDIGGNMSFLIDGYGAGNADALMTDEEILDEIIKANE